MDEVCDNRNCTKTLPEKPYKLEIIVKANRPLPLGDEQKINMSKSYCSFDCYNEVLDRILKAIE